MQTKLIIILLFFALFGCIVEPEEEKKIDEIPTGIVVLNPCTTLTDSIINLFPPGQNSTVNNPAFFSDTIQKKIVLSKESEVYVTFLDEGAGYRNSLCWYTYNNQNPPSKISDIKRNIVFPNISKKGEGGELEAGYTLQLGSGKLPAGSVIGFILIVNGWQDGTINYNNASHYTDFNLNTGGFQQHVLFKEKNCGDIVVAFEDKALDIIDCDKDFNDILFIVSDNKNGYESTSFDLNKVIIK